MTTPQLIWDVGTAYDLFISLYTLHNPNDFGLRGAWAVGVRSRLPTAEREFLQAAVEVIHWPLNWVYALPRPKDAATAIAVLDELPAPSRLPALACLDEDEPYDQVLLDVAAKKSWDARDEQALQDLTCEAYKAKGKKGRRKDFSQVLAWWANPEEFGVRLLAGLKVYHEVFFAEDEARIRPALEQAVEKAQKLAQEMSIPALLEALSQGVQFDEAPDVRELVLVPSFWGSPLLLYGKEVDDRMIFGFGGRPANASIVPGEVIPDALYQGLKALADPTRLRILHYLMAEPLTPTELANRLRLRAPTVVHHLHTLRLARLVQLTMSYEGKKYRARREAIEETYALLNEFLDQGHP